MSKMYETLTFAEIFPQFDVFKEAYDENELAQPLKDSNVKVLYYLLYAKYGNSSIANYDINQFMYKVWSIIFKYGPTWEKRLEIQEKARALTDEELMSGSKAIYNHAFNPGDEPSTGSLEELDYINEQNTTNYKRSKIESYQLLWELLKTDVTEAFLLQFKNLFLKVVEPVTSRIYISEEDDE